MTTIDRSDKKYDVIIFFFFFFLLACYLDNHAIEKQRLFISCLFEINVLFLKRHENR